MSELDEIKRQYESGKLDSIKQDLERFIARHRAEMAAYRAEQERKGLALSDEALIRLYVLRHRSINPQREILDQLDEIQKEKWIRGVQTGKSPDAQEVALDWARSFSSHWRAHRVATILYLLEREPERYLPFLRGS